MNQNTHAGATPPALPKKSSSRLALIVTIVSILLIPPTAILIWYVSVRTSNSSAIRKLEAEARQRGEPLTLEEQASKYPPIPDEENAAVALIAIWTAEDPPFWEAFMNDEQPLPKSHIEQLDPALPYLSLDARRIPRLSPLDSNSLAAADAYLSDKASHLEQVRTAIRRPRFRFPVKFEDGPYALLPHLALLKKEALNLRLVALIASERGDSRGAISALNDTARIGRLLADEPILISQFVRVSCLEMSMKEMERLLSRQPLTVDQLEKLRLLLDETNLHGVARTALINERADALCSFDPDTLALAATHAPSEDGEDSPEQTAYKVRTGSALFQAVGYWDLDRRLMLETLKDGIALAELETPESITKYEELFDDTAIKARKFPPKIFSSLVLPSLQRIPRRYASYEAHRLSAMTAVAIELFRLDNAGQIPERIESLVPKYLAVVPQDPFHESALHFHKSERGYVVYSIGADRQDNDGKEYLKGSIDHTDITFFVER